MGLFSYLINKNKTLADGLQEENSNETNKVEPISTIRLYYVALEKFSAYGTNQAKIGQTYGISSPFKLPEGMCVSDACKVISYLSEKIEKENNLQPACEKSVALTSSILSDYGFEEIETDKKGYYHTVSEYVPLMQINATAFPACKRINGVADFFTVGGDFKIFKSTDLYERYFNWFKEGITRQDVEAIYKKIGANHLLPKRSKQEKNI